MKDTVAKNGGIAARIRRLVLIVTATALCLAVGAYSALAHHYGRSALVDHLHVLAQVIGDNTAAAITFDDPATARQVLRTLEAEPDVHSAVVILPNGQEFASAEWVDANPGPAHDDDWLQATLTRARSEPVVRFDASDIDLLMPIKLDSETIGILHLEGGLGRLERQALVFAGATFAILMFLLGGVYLVSNRLQQRISRPIRELADGMNRVSSTQDYALRVGAKADDEVGDLIDGFNNMLGQIEQRDRAIADNQRDLERKVEARTADLAEAKDLAEAGSRAKSEFLATMSHEIRTPMNGVLGMTELLLGSGLTPRQQRLADTAYRSAESLLGVINNILDFSKIEAGRLDLNSEQVALRPLFDDTLELLADQAHRKGIELIADLPPDLPLRISCDATRVRQILVNLLGNAVKFTENGEVRVSVRTQPADAGRTTLNVDISDTGPGIPEDQQAHIFDAFFQADSSASRRFGGTGLGLTITQRLVRMMGGQISLHSRPGQGTRFSLSIPVETIDKSQDQPQLRAMSGTRVLIVDDHETNREILCNQVAAWGMREEWAANADDALAMARRAASAGVPFQIIILDWQMPGTDGLELARQLQADPLIPLASMVMLSSAGDDLISLQARENGISCYLTKPVRQDRLLACLLDTQKDRRSVDGSDVVTRQSLFLDTHVLLAEDNFVNQEVALGMLELLGCQVSIAENGQKAIDACKREHFDLVLMDCHMPIVDGFEATAAIRSLEQQEDSGRVPVIALTADVQKGVEQRCIQAGMDAYLSKPFDQNGLTEVLQRWLPGKVHQAVVADSAVSGAAHVPAVLDREPIEQLQRVGSANGRDVLGEVARLFLEQLPGMLREAKEGLEGRDYETVRRVAHSLKSSSANIGARELSQASAALEAAARDGDTAGVDTGYTVFELKASEALDAVRDLLDAEQQGDGPKPVDAPIPVDDSTGLQRILIVDNDSVFRITTEEALRAEGFVVISAANGRDALDMVQSRQPDLVLLDAIMEGIDGFTTCRKLRQTPGGENLPVIMVTGLDEPDSLERAFQAGATGFSTKPVNYPALVQRIRFMLRASSNESELRDHKAMLQTAQRVARLGYWRWDQINGRFELSDNLRELFGIAPHDQIETLDAYLDLIIDDDRDVVRNRLKSAIDDRQKDTLDYRVRNANNEIRIVQQDLEVIPNASHLEILGTVQDVTAQRESEDQIRKMAYFDALTGLASRSHLIQHLDDTIRLARRRKEEFTILFLDLDGFKDVNDSLGHDIGDFMLVGIARRLLELVRDVDFVARLGGDEFCILLNDNRDELDAAEVATRCLELINEPIELGNQLWRPHVSIGLARFPIDGETAGELLKAADSAMYAAKQAGKHRYAFYRPEMTQEAERRLANEQKLREAIEQEQFELYYQPQIEMRSGRVKTVEALARWHHPERGIVMPSEFIATLERIGLICELGKWVIRKACTQVKRWSEQGLPPVCVAVNVSPLHFHDPSILHTVSSALTESGISPNQLEIEITESSVQSDTKAMVVLRQLQALGVRISIDDFGTGYSSLGSLKHLPIDTLKIDRVFIMDMLEQNQDALMLGTIIGLAHALGYSVVAEGVEERDQATVLAGLHCDLAQGYLFSHPTPAHQIGALLTRETFFDSVEKNVLAHGSAKVGGTNV